jgi:hypothetical protein
VVEAPSISYVRWSLGDSFGETADLTNVPLHFVLLHAVLTLTITSKCEFTKKLHKELCSLGCKTMYSVEM